MPDTPALVVLTMRDLSASLGSFNYGLDRRCNGGGDIRPHHRDTSDLGAEHALRMKGVPFE